MPFGKHKGTPLEDVPDDYLWWVLGKCDNVNPYLIEAIRRRLGVTATPPPPPPPRPPPPAGVSMARVKAVVLESVKKWHRTQAMRNHPDRGGNPEVAKVVNDLADQLTREISAAFDAAGT